MNLHMREPPPPSIVTLPCTSRDPKGWWLAELLASAILTDWSSMCYTPINGSNYQWARLWTLQTEVNKHNRPCGPSGVGVEVVVVVGINLLTEGLCLPLSLARKVRKSFCLIIVLTQHVLEPSPSPFTSNRINEILYTAVISWALVTFLFTAAILQSPLSLQTLSEISVSKSCGISRYITSALYAATGNSRTAPLLQAWA